MDRLDAFLLAVAAFFLGTLIASVLWVGPLARQSRQTMDVEAQLTTCNDGREVLHRQLHLLNDSLLLREHHK